MIKKILSFVFLLLSYDLMAQWQGAPTTQYFAGPVGIGLTTPPGANKLTVSGQTLLENPSGRTLMIQRNDEDSWITFHDNDNMWYSMGIDYSDARKFKLNYGGLVGERTHFVMTSEGKVGIGTDAPSNRLDVIDGFEAGNKTSLFVGQNHNFGANTGSYGIGLQLDHIDGTAGGKLGHLMFWFANTPAKVMTFNYLGNVGIGTTAPDAKLVVNGDIHAKEVRVDLNVPGPDYVFDEKYELPRLSEVERYINQNKHLPEVPSAKEMEQDGINVGEMDMLLLKKVEELTLYVIEVKKENEEQQKRIEAQQKEIEILKKK